MDNDTLFHGFIIFFLSFYGVIWIFRRSKE